MTDDYGEGAVAAKVVASRVMANVLRRVVDGTDEVWDLYPEIGQHDWDHVLEEVGHVAAALDCLPDTFTWAYNLLGARADAS